MRRLIVCLDGTWMGPARGVRSTNVVNLMRALEHEDGAGVRQVVYYGRVVGAHRNLAYRLFGGAAGSGLEENVKDAYVFLGNNYVEGDEIYLFGFSRGAFTARSLAGFLGAAGLLDRHSLGRLGEAWEYYRTPPDERRKEDHPGGRDVRVECLGVWDTVGARGIPVRWFQPAQWYRQWRYGFHDVALGASVRCALHGLAVDEKRGPFKPTLWEIPDGEDVSGDRVVEQVWFAGCHSDVGGGVGPKGGSRKDVEGASGLPDLALEWMVERVRANTGLAFREDWREQKRSIRGDPLAPLHDPRRLPGGLPYAVSLLLPFERVIGGQDAWTRRVFRSRNRPSKGCRFVNEAVHASVLERMGKVPRGAKDPYNPVNVQTALDAGVSVVPWRRDSGDEAQGESGETRAEEHVENLAGPVR